MNRRIALMLSCLAVGSLLMAQGTGRLFLETDRAVYTPGATVTVSALAAFQDSDSLAICCWRNDEMIVSQRRACGVSPVRWTWTVPVEDFRGYLVSVSLIRGGASIGTASIGIDVSSQSRRYPRYGFVSWYPKLPADSIDRVVRRLNRYHINYLQFYDWQYKHHKPLKGTPEHPADEWKDVANRPISRATVEGYIRAAHTFGMKAMSYNLLYGAYADAPDDGADLKGWSLYKDAAAGAHYMYDLSPAWASDIYFMNPANPDWQRYLCAAERDVFKAFAFDGWQVDQVGDPGPLFDASGNKVIVKDGFEPFLAHAADELPGIEFVMNAVNQYGQEGIARAPVSFLYTEIWDTAVTYGGVRRIIEQNRGLSGGRCNTSLAAYMNYRLADSPGMFNTPGVLLADAVIMASGGAHLELGEHMLVHEYFPNNNRRMSEELEERLRAYYDMMCAYEHLLRGPMVNFGARSALGSPGVLSSEDRAGMIWAIARSTEKRDIWHFVNFTGIDTMAWRDQWGTQRAPTPRTEVPVTIQTNRQVVRVWCASPDDGCVPRPLPVKHVTDGVAVIVPSVSYWTMLVVEYKE